MEFREAFETVLERLEIQFSAPDINQDPDTTQKPLHLSIINPDHIADTPHDKPNHLRLPLAITDLSPASRKWLTALRKIGEHIDRPAIVHFAEANDDPEQTKTLITRFPGDPIAIRLIAEHTPDNLLASLASAKARAHEAETAAAHLHAQLATAQRELKQERTARIAERGKTNAAEFELTRLRAHIEDTTYALALVPAKHQNLVQTARDHSWRARLEAAEADRLAKQFPDVLHWPISNASYSGETKNQMPHGRGVMTFQKNGRVISSYRGSFELGARHGHGVGSSPDGDQWIGEWQHDEANGYGLLENPNGPRLEGTVKPPTKDAPASRNLYRWNAPSPATKHTQLTKPDRPALPTP